MNFRCAFVIAFVVLSSASASFAQRSADDYLRLSQQRLESRDLKGAIEALNKAIVRANPVFLSPSPVGRGLG
jgi:hypothetical protein